MAMCEFTRCHRQSCRGFKLHVLTLVDNMMVQLTVSVRCRVREKGPWLGSTAGGWSLPSSSKPRAHALCCGSA
jgi:hypothetical protein